MLERFLSWLFPCFSRPPEVRLGRLALALIYVGGLVGFGVCRAAIAKALNGPTNMPEDLKTLLVFVAGVAFLAQVPIGHALARERVWAVFAAYWTFGVLFGYACLAVAVNHYFQRFYIPLPALPFIYAVVCYFVLRSTHLAQSIAAQGRRRIDRNSLLD